MTAHGGSGNVVWARVGSDGRSRLVHRIRNRNRDLPVRPKAGLFDPDLGMNAQGHRVIVYTRCAGLSGRDCDVWQYDVADRRESKVPGASTAACSEFAPVGLDRRGRVREQRAGEVQRALHREAQDEAEAGRARAGRDRPARAPGRLPAHPAG